MRSNKRRDTGPELRVRTALHRRGFRYRVDFAVRVPELRAVVRPDVVFTKRRVAVFVDGCFWHCCPTHGSMPARNRGYWEPKLKANVERDARTTHALEAAGWVVIRIWEHEDPESAAEVVAAALVARSG